MTRLEKKRLALGMTREDLASRAGISHRTIYLHETGRALGKASVVVRRALAAALGSKTSFLFDLKGVAR